MPVTTARQRVLAYLQKQRAASALQIGRALAMTAANARHHLSILLADGRIAIVGEIRGEGRGRPVRLYGLSERLLGDNLALLADALLEARLGGLPAGKKEEALKLIARSLAGRTELTDQGMPMARRLALAVERLQALNYQARWEAGAEGPRIILGYCPYAALIEKHPELCRMDGFLLEAQLGCSSRQIAKLERGAQGVRVCIFAISM